MILLYQLHWSHYVEKVRWALDFKGLAWRAIDVDPFSKREMRHLRCKTHLDNGGKEYTVPTIHDESTGAILSESSNIVEYLEQTYPTPSLHLDDEVKRWMLWFDSTVGLASRRLAYTQIALEHPAILSGLFMPKLPAGSVKAAVAGRVIAGVLTRRFRFRHNRADRVFEQLEQCLLTAAERLSDHSFLVDEQFSAADLTLAALMRPVVLVPYFRNHPRLQRLFDWRMQQLREHRRTEHVDYESALHEVRTRRGWTFGAVPWLSAEASAPTGVPALAAPRNDQQAVGGWPMITGPFEYLRLKQTCELGRTAYPEEVSRATSGNQISRQR
jgi:glutathione S-transferase